MQVQRIKSYTMKQNGVMSEIGRDADEGQGETKQKQISKE